MLSHIIIFRLSNPCLLQLFVLAFNNSVSICWGRTSATSVYGSTTSTTITFSRTFSSVFEATVCRLGNGQSTGQTVEWISNLTVSNIKINLYQPVSGGGSWSGSVLFIAIGT